MEFTSIYAYVDCPDIKCASNTIVIWSFYKQDLSHSLERELMGFWVQAMSPWETDSTCSIPTQKLFLHDTDIFVRQVLLSEFENNLKLFSPKPGSLGLYWRPSSGGQGNTRYGRCYAVMCSLQASLGLQEAPWLGAAEFSPSHGVLPVNIVSVQISPFIRTPVTLK
jgi:hypothetical protein